MISATDPKQPFDFQRRVAGLTAMRMLSQDWNDIRNRYQTVFPSESWAASMIALVDHVAESPVGQGLHPWTAMFDLIITQTGDAPEDGTYPFPHLRISPKSNGKIEFRYVDTLDQGRQWKREVESSRAIQQFDKFVGQLGWLV